MNILILKTWESISDALFESVDIDTLDLASQGGNTE